MAKRKIGKRDVLQLAHEWDEHRVIKGLPVKVTLRDTIALREDGRVLHRRQWLYKGHVEQSTPWTEESGGWHPDFPDTIGVWVAGCVRNGWALTWGAPELRHLVRLPEGQGVARAPFGDLIREGVTA